MIKIENNTFYLTAGEACYIFGIEDGVPAHIYFGKRVEPEDDVRELGYGADKIAELTVQIVAADGKKQNAEFVFDGAEVTESDAKKLVVTLKDKKHSLTARMYYTPNPRGGLYRQAEIENFGGEIVLCAVRQSIARGNGCNVVVADGYNNATKDTGYLAVATSAGLDEQKGDAYGFLCAAADGAVTAPGENAISCEIDGSIRLEGGQKYACPEMLCVYSDSGLGGMTRIFHDILREKQGGLSERIPAVLFLPIQEERDALASVKTAVEIGFGVVAVDCGRYSAPAIQTLASACAEQGITLGLRVNRENIYKDSALYSPLCKKSGGEGGYKYGYSDEHTLALIETLSGIIAQNDVRYVTIDAPFMSDAKAARGMFTLKDRLAERFEGLRVDFGIMSDTLGKEFTFCYPLGMVRNIISPLPAESFKQRFDCATLGTLGYELPTELSDGIKRAVRAQILSYQDDARSVMRGDMYRQHGEGGACRMAVSKDKSRAYAVCEVKNRMRLKFFGLDEHNLYHVREMNKTFSGAALVHCGVALKEAGTYVFHILQVADY